MTATTTSRETQPIAALASGPGPAAVSIIRVSGAPPANLKKIVVPKHSKHKEAPLEPRRPRLCKIIDPSSGELLDEALVIYFAAPASFTGEDVFEIQCHGGPYIIQRILKTLFAHGIRQADPGEFTKRAFLNGKMDLTESEGIRDLVNAQSHQQWVAARHLTTGKLRDLIEHLRKLLIEAMAYLEVQIDFPDEGDTAHLHIEHVKARTDQVRATLHKLLTSYESGHVASQGLRVALYGEPNAGKSTLMNTLLDKERAIVTDIAGTTRDYIEEPCLVNGRLIRLFDMAGIRESADKVEAIGVEHAKRLAQQADLVLVLCPANQDTPHMPSDEERSLFKDVVQIVTKSDLGTPAWLGKKAKEWLPISCAKDEGIDTLRQLLADRVDSFVNQLSEEGFITTDRHRAAVLEALSFLNQFYDALGEGAHEEMLAFELLEATRSLKGIVGEVSGDDLLDKIFSEFCLGK